MVQLEINRYRFIGEQSPQVNQGRGEVYTWQFSPEGL